MRRYLISLASVLLCLGTAMAQTLPKAEDLYKHTEYEASLALLDKHSKDAATQFLIGRDYYMLGDFKRSTDYLQKATQAAPANSEYMDWLGRVYGKRAETSNPLLAPGLASKARQAFERAVQLNPKDADALSDLFDYYLDAPGFLGGGYEKAQAVAAKMSVIDPPEGHFERAKLAQKQHELEEAESHLKDAIAVTPQKIGGMLALAKLLATEGKVHESDAVLAKAQTLSPNSPQLLFTRADLLIREKRNPDEARNLLHQYMKTPITVDDPPKEDALRLLKQVGGA